MQIKAKIENWAKETLGRSEGFSVVHPKDLKNGDFTLIINGDGAKADFEKLEQNQLIEINKIEFVVPRFINIYLSENFFAESIGEVNEKGEKFGNTNLLEDQKIFIEHTQPNPFKQFHIGHLMNNAIGEAVARILKANNAQTRVCSYHGDVGLHVAKAIWGLRISDQVSSIDHVDISMLGQAYARGAADFEKDNHAKESVLEINKIIYAQRNDDTESQWVNTWYKKGKSASLDYFNSIYKRLDSFFDFHFFESEAGQIGQDLVREKLGKVFEESEGAVVFRGENFEPKTHTRVFLNKEGLPTYEAKEVGLAKIKREKWPEYTKSITVTANEQDSFFDVVEVAIGEVFPELKGKLKHLSHGMLKLPSGKMSSRTGDVITAESLISKVKEMVMEKIVDREFSPEEKEQVAEVVAIGAIKYSILRQAIGGDIIFDFDKSISFEGDSGPYLQYTCVRAKSVLEKAKISQSETLKNFPKVSPWETTETTEVERMLYRFPEIVEKAGQEYAPHYLVTYLVELSAAFNSFYASNKIIDEDSPEVTAYRLALTKAVSIVLTKGLNLLGIRVPERM